MNETFIYIYRKFKYWEWYHKSEMVHFFLHLLIEANVKAKNWQGIEIQRGQFITSLDKLSSQTKLSKRTVRTCLSRLKTTHEITLKTTHKYTIITICNYDNYQTYKNSNDTVNDTVNDTEPTQNRHTNDTEPTLTNNGNNDNNFNKRESTRPRPIKKQYFDCVFLTDEEYGKLLSKHGEDDTNKMLEQLNWWKLDKQTENQQKKGCDYAKIKKWVEKWLIEEKRKTEKPENNQNSRPGPGAQTPKPVYTGYDEADVPKF